MLERFLHCFRFFNSSSESPNITSLPPALRKLFTTFSVRPDYQNKMMVSHQVLTCKKKLLLWGYDGYDGWDICVSSPHTYSVFKDKSLHKHTVPTDIHKIYFLSKDLKESLFWAMYLKYFPEIIEAHIVLDAFQLIEPSQLMAICSELIKKMAETITINCTLHTVVILFPRKLALSEENELFSTLTASLINNTTLKTLTLGCWISDKNHFLACLQTLLEKNSGLENMDFPYVNGTLTDDEKKAILQWMAKNSYIKKIKINDVSLTNQMPRATREAHHSTLTDRTIDLDSLENIFEKHSDYRRLLKPINEEDPAYCYANKMLAASTDDSLCAEQLEYLASHYTDAFGFYANLALAFHYKEKQEPEKVQYYLALLSSKQRPSSFTPLKSNPVSVKLLNEPTFARPPISRA